MKKGVPELVNEVLTRLGWCGHLTPLMVSEATGFFGFLSGSRNGVQPGSFR